MKQYRKKTVIEGVKDPSLSLVRFGYKMNSQEIFYEKWYALFCADDCAFQLILFSPYDS